MIERIHDLLAEEEARQRKIIDLAVGHRYGIQTIARRTGVLPGTVSTVLKKNKIEFHPTLKEWRVRK